MSNPYKVLLEETRGLVNKWQPTGLLEGLDGDTELSSMAILLENQSKEIIEESTKTGGTDAEAWAGVALPLVRRIFGEIAAKEFVSVQPMNLPAGLVFYLDFKYAQGTTQPGFTAGTSVFGGSNNSLTDNVGKSLLDYLQHSRPTVSCNEVFLTVNAPYIPLGLSEASSDTPALTCTASSSSDNPIEG